MLDAVALSSQEQLQDGPVARCIDTLQPTPSGRQQSLFLIETDSARGHFQLAGELGDAVVPGHAHAPSARVEPGGCCLTPSDRRSKLGRMNADRLAGVVERLATTPLRRQAWLWLLGP